MNKFIIETYGCQMNIADSELVATILKDAGYFEADSIEDADIIIFNTCSVRQHAEERVKGRISNEQARKKNKSDLVIGVMGCMAQRMKEELIALNIGVDFIVGVDQYHNIPEIIESKSTINADFNSAEVYHNIYPTRKGNFNAFVTIMRGCNNFCTYCIVPYVRGRERSRPLDEILREVRLAGEEGFKDITLLGQNVNSYSFDGIKFPQLMQKVSDIDTIKRIRFVTSHPKDLSDDLIEVMAANERICKHVHLPLQSGDDEILRRMNRGYTASHYRGIIDKLRRAMPNIGLTTDVIVGFPGETEEQYRKTYDLMKEVEYDYAFMYKYSPRTGTKAADFAEQVPEEVRLSRLKEIIELQREITLQKFRSQIGSIKEVYVENVSKKSAEELSGKTEDFKIAVFKGDKSLIGSFVNIEITDATSGTLIGRKV
ncbi:MAG: tRNA (N6-isopentenyl adenosine(37)-C2)-methylthiotransferase MiaB [Candidatus Cloacimonetes bacterium]|nr:tRNA (N6-isopentenyl adenosine(37)-C2)-methylthiotransferase MiaB [Candidatus Cloacimonadota bacterium]